MTYRPGQARGIFPFVRRTGVVPKWAIIAGPADGDEAQCMIAKWPRIKVIGVDPNPEAVAWQASNSWPEGHPLIEAALSDSCSCERCWFPGGCPPRHASLLGPMGGEDCPSRLVKATTLNTLDREHGPFEDAVLWLDIEGYEHKALCGAAKLLERKAFLLVMVEMLPRNAENNELADRLLTDAGYVHSGNLNRNDLVYVRN